MSYLIYAFCMILVMMVFTCPSAKNHREAVYWEFRKAFRKDKATCGKVDWWDGDFPDDVGCFFKIALETDEFDFEVRKYGLLSIGWLCTAEGRAPFSFGAFGRVWVPLMADE